MSVFVMLHPLGRNSHQNEGPPRSDMAWQRTSEDVVTETLDNSSLLYGDILVGLKDNSESMSTLA